MNQFHVLPRRYPPRPSLVDSMSFCVVAKATPSLLIGRPARLQVVALVRRWGKWRREAAPQQAARHWSASLVLP